MVNNIFFIFFKLLRKLSNSYHSVNSRLKISYYYFISKQQFVLKSSLIMGRRFSINADITATHILIDDNCRIRNNFNIKIGNNGDLRIGKDCFFNNNCSLNCLHKIDIGNNNQFGEGVLMYDHNHSYQNVQELISEQGYVAGEIKIGNNCWIGSNVVILKNVEIGDNVIIGAGCTIYKSIPPGSIVTNHQNLVIKSRL